MVLVEEHLKGGDIGQLVGVDQVGREHERGRGVMSEKHVDS
jgi:hypothetical protein